MFDQTDNLEQRLLAVIATSDPKFAYQKAMESLDKGEFPNGIGNILAQLQTKDEEAYKKLTDKTMNRLASDSLLANRQATSLAIALLFPGPRPTGNATAASAAINANATANTMPAMGMNSRQAPVLNETAYHDLMDNAVNAALSVTSMGPMGNVQIQRGGGPQRVMRGPQGQQQTQPDETQVRQNNARNLLFSLQAMLPQIDQYLPERAAAVRQKLTDLGMNNNQLTNMGNQMRAMQQGSSDALLTAASTAPQPVQARMYQQAAQRAIQEGNIDRAVDIATNHLDENGRAVIMQAVDFKKLTTTASPEKMNEIKQKLAALPSDSDRLKYLIDLANATQKDNPKLALRFLEDARGLVTKRAMNYRDFEDQLKVADAYAAVDPKRSFEIIDAGIAEVNELLAAATVLNGFEVEIFRDGELSTRSDSDLVRMVARFGSQIAALAKVDFDGARATADKFQMPEARMTARLSIVQNALGAQPTNVNNRNQNFQFFMR
jgi:ribosomal protein L20